MSLLELRLNFTFGPSQVSSFKSGIGSVIVPFEVSCYMLLNCVGGVGDHHVQYL